MIELDLDYAPPSDLLADRAVLVTGAGDGIGRAACIGLARHGASVVLLGRTVSKLERTYDCIVEAGGPQPAIYPLDLAGAQPRDFDELAERVGSQLGRLHAVVHNAAALGDLSPIAHYEPSTWARVIQVNLHAPFLLTQSCLGLLQASADATVVFTTCRVGREPRAYWGAYAVSKHACGGLARLLAEELTGETGVRVSTFDPGAVRTGLRARAYPAEDPASLRRPEDLVPAYLYLLGPEGRAHHGESFTPRA